MCYVYAYYKYIYKLNCSFDVSIVYTNQIRKEWKIYYRLVRETNRDSGHVHALFFSCNESIYDEVERYSYVEFLDV